MSKLVVSVLNLCRKSLARTAAKHTKECEKCTASIEQAKHDHEAELQDAWEAYQATVSQADRAYEQRVASLKTKAGVARSKKVDAEHYLAKLS